MKDRDSLRAASRPALAALVVAAGVLACSTPAPRPQGTLPTGPAAGDSALSPFYAWTGKLPERPGVLLRREAFPDQPEFTSAVSMERILYTSLDARWNSGMIPVSGTLYLPKGDPPAGGWPIVSWAHGTLGVADVCAPSWARHRPRDATYLNRWLQEGFAVVATDYQGLGGPGPHPYLVWEAEGRSVLDGVRAAMAAFPGRIANTVIVTGQSQGSGSSLGASRIAPAYAPELRLRATIATGVLSTFPQGPVQQPEATPGRGAPTRFTMLRLVGGSIRDGGPAADALVHERARPMLDAARTTCVDEMRGIEQRLGLDMTNAFTRDPATLNGGLLPVTDMPSQRLPTPVFLGTGLADRTMPPRRQYAAAAALCATGGPVLWKTYPGITHNGIVNTAFDDELRWVRSILTGGSAADSCASMADPGAPGTATPGIRFND